MDIANKIDWSIISYAIHYYETIGYQYIEVPWIVPTSISRLTCPKEALIAEIKYSSQSLVGSSEQSFLKLEFDGILPKGKYVACSPCFRLGENDTWHSPTFMKVELYRNDNIDILNLHETIAHAESFFHDHFRYNKKKKNIERIETSDGIDILLNGIEIGSYGIRNLGGFNWIYGTGVALPRFTKAINENPSTNTK